MDSRTVCQWLSEAAACLSAKRDHLTQLDAAIGDADHGANTERGFAAALEHAAAVAA
jgi:dihydroxyacetone kinase-like protein